jgi:hypothetical protein
MSGAIIYRGPSQIDGAPIVVIATLGSKNRKTGPMLQTWILRSDVGPLEASRAGQDSSICGQCPHRHSLNGACYVDIGRAPMAIYNAFRRGSYLSAETSADRIALGMGRAVRLGAYGDPAAVPLRVWADLLFQADCHTGYTHQWREGFALALRDVCMASVDSDAELDTARAMGWRTFRVMRADEPLASREFICPATVSDRQCHQCKACDGAPRGASQASVAIVVHGALARRFSSTN